MVAVALLIGVMVLSRTPADQAKQESVEVTAKGKVRSIATSELTTAAAESVSIETMAANDNPDATTPVAAPEPPTTVPVVTTLTSTIPEPTTAPTVAGQTLIVGVGPGENTDLGTAIAQAKPGDTILIRHRGPLEFKPIDLTEKKPLTIAGDIKDGVDYWPILRQAVLPEGAPVPAAAKGLFFGKNVQLTFRKVPLGMGGHQSQPIESAFHLSSGRWSFQTARSRSQPVAWDSIRWGL